MKKLVTAFAAAMLIGPLAACGSTNAAAEQTSKWGAPLVEALDRCDPTNTVTEMGCYHTAITDAQADAPDSEKELFVLYYESYAKLVSDGCVTSIELACIIPRKQTTSLVNGIREAASEAAAT